MKRVPWNICVGTVSVMMFILAILIVPQAVTAQQTWHAVIGAASTDQGRQAMAFLPNELWIYAGDSVTWTSGTKEGHTLTFLKTSPPPTQVRPPFTGPPPSFGGCPGGTPPFGTTPSDSNFTGTTCVNSGPFVNGSYTVKFPSTGNFKFVCLIHSDMTGVVHVLSLAATLPHNQAFYDQLASAQANDLIKDADRVTDDEHTGNSTRFANSSNEVITTGETVATGGGKAYLAIMRFLPETIRVHVGETVEWTNVHPAEPHTVTFGTEPALPFILIGVTPDSDGALHGTLPNAATSDSFNSGLYGPALQDQTGLAQTALGTTRVRVTFTKAGTYNYICALHDELGMKGTVIVTK